MQPMNFQVCQKIFAEGAEIGAVAKTSWSDAHKLPIRSEQSLDEGNKACIKITRFNANIAQASPFCRIRANFPVGRIYNGGIENGRLRAEQIIGKAGRHFLNEVGFMDDEAELNASPITKTLAILHRFQQGILNAWVKFVESRFDGANAVFFLTQARNEGCRECSRACSGIQ